MTSINKHNSKAGVDSVLKYVVNFKFNRKAKRKCNYLRRQVVIDRRFPDMIDGDIARSAEKCRSTAIKEPRMGSRPLFGRNLALFRVRLGSLRGGTIGNSYRTSGTNNKSVHYNISKAIGTEAVGKLIRHEHRFPSKQKLG